MDVTDRFSKRHGYNLGNLQTRHSSEKWMSKNRVQVDVTSPGNFRRLLHPGLQIEIGLDSEYLLIERESWGE